MVRQLVLYVYLYCFICEQKRDVVYLFSPKLRITTQEMYRLFNYHNSIGIDTTV